MSDTPRTNAEAFLPHDSKYRVCDADFARTLERELNAAQQRIKRLEATTNDPHALWANWLRGSVTLPVGIGDVREYQDHIKRLEEDLIDAKNQYAVLVADVVLYEDRGERIKRLEDIISRAAYAFFRDGSDGKAANGMLTILEEVRLK